MINASTVSFVCDALKRKTKEQCNIQQSIEELRKKYMDHPLEGMTSADIRSMSGEALFDMDCFLNDDESDDDFGEDGFYIF